MPRRGSMEEHTHVTSLALERFSGQVYTLYVLTQ